MSHEDRSAHPARQPKLVPQNPNLAPWMQYYHVYEADPGDVEDAAAGQRMAERESRSNRATVHDPLR